MARGLHRFIFAGCTIYLLFTCYTAYLLVRRAWNEEERRQNGDADADPDAADPHRVALPQENGKNRDTKDEDDWNPWGEEFEEDSEPHKTNVLPMKSTGSPAGQVADADPLRIEIWGKAAIGLYLWENILQGTLRDDPHGLSKIGTAQVGDVEFNFRTGASVTQSTVPAEAKHVVLVLNGRSPEKVDLAKTWLDFALRDLKDLRGLALVLLGDESCRNGWLNPYLEKLDAVFVVYDAPLVDNVRFFQWPLGVATYRRFPNIEMERALPDVPRRYLCNFVGTVYANSSREQAMHVLNARNSSAKGECFIRARSTWEPSETADSLDSYVEALLSSDITISPPGMNPECYRLYEALSCGSVPVVLRTDAASSPASACDTSSSPSLRLLRAYAAPFIHVDSWDDLPAILDAEAKMSREAKTARRRRVLSWYGDFRNALRDHFARTLKSRFLGRDRSL